jgi:hypothetical protein
MRLSLGVRTCPCILAPASLRACPREPRATKGGARCPRRSRRHERTLLTRGSSSRLLGTRPQLESGTRGPGPVPHLRFAGIGGLGPAPAAPDLPESGTWPRPRPTRTPVPDSNLPAGGGLRVGIGEFAEKGPAPPPSSDTHRGVCNLPRAAPLRSQGPPAEARGESGIERGGMDQDASTGSLPVRTSPSAPSTAAALAS